MNNKEKFRFANEAQEEAVKALDLRTCLEHYGLYFNARGFACCPFHQERTASFGIRGRFWHCFGCGESGELIKFVRKRFDLSYGEALDAIHKDFGIAKVQPSAEDLERVERAQTEKRDAVKQYKDLLDVLDIQTQIYFLAKDTLDYVIDFRGGKSIDNEKYVAAHFAVMNSEMQLEKLEYEIAQFAREHPEAVRGLREDIRRNEEAKA